MAWQSLGKADLINGGVVYGYCHFEYNDTSSNPRSVRLRISERSGYTFYIDFRNVTVAGTNVGSFTNLTQSSGTFWTGTVAGGRNVTASWTNPWYAGTQTPSITGYLPTASSGPSGLSVKYNSSTWNSINITSSVSSWGSGYSGTPNLEQIIVNSSATSSNWTSKGRIVKQNATTSLSSTQSVSNSNYNLSLDGGVTVKGASNYKIAAWASTSVASVGKFDNTLRYTPPAPLSSVTYTQSSSSTGVNVTVTIKGGNSTKNSSNTVTTSYRYSTDGGTTYTSWTSAGTGTAWTAKTVTFSVPYSSSVSLQARQTYQGKNSSVTTISFNSTEATAPSGFSVVTNSKTWNSVNLTGSISSYGAPSEVATRTLNIGVGLTPDTATSALEQRNQAVTSSTVTVNDNSTAVHGGFTLKGMMTVYPYVYANNTVKNGYIFESGEVLPPAPGQLTYVIDPNDESNQTITYVGIPANNDTDYTQSLLTRTVRYKGQNDANWTYVENDTQIALDTVTTQPITVPANTTTVVEAWMTYNGLQSQVSTVNLTNSQDPVKLYCSMGNKTELVEKLYGSVNGESKKIKKLYASVNGVAKLIYEDAS